jgi:hypothetical protein
VTGLPFTDAQLVALSAAVLPDSPIRQLAALRAPDEPRFHRFPLHERMRDGIDPPDILVPGLTYREGLHWISGPPKEGKSWIGRYIALETHRNTGQPTVWIDHEAGFKQTAQALGDMGLSPEEVEQVLVYVELPDLHGLQPSAVKEELSAMVKQYNAAALVIDSAGKQLAALGLDEDRAAEVTRWTAGALIPLTKECGISVLVIDHTPKSDRGRSGYARGSGEKLAAVEVAWTVTSEPFSLDQAGIITLRHRGNDRNGRLPASARFRAGGQGGLSPFRLEPLGPETPRQASLVDEIVAAVQNSDSGTLRTADIAKAVGVDKEDGTFKRALRYSLDEGLTTKHERGLYSVDADADMDI